MCQSQMQKEQHLVVSSEGTSRMKESFCTRSDVLRLVILDVRRTGVWVIFPIHCN